MNRLIVGGLLAAAVVLGGGAWWYSTQRAAPGDAATAGAPIVADAPSAPEAVAAGAAPASAAVETANGAAVAAAGPNDKFTLERGVCFGPCPVYVVTVTGDDRLRFEGQKFCSREGVHERDLPQGSFNRLLAIAQRHEFTSIDSLWPDEKGLNCPEPPTDLPSVSVAFDTRTIKHSVKFYEGCSGYPGADKVMAMIKEFDVVLGLDDWIGPREQWYGKRQKP